MIIYPIAEQLERLMDSFIDFETGELTVSEEEMQQQIEQLQMDFDTKIVDLRNEYINRIGEAKAIKEERARLEIRQKRAEDSAERLKRWIAYLLKGEKFQKEVCKISYRASEEVVFDNDNPDQFVEWAEKSAPDLLSYKKPEPRKSEIKKAIKAGQAVEFAHIQSKQNVQIK